ncbi:hypothetical protein BGZ57DRAFT_905007 [Hyaloscypha finlandica]|nr:hypothetical protein BGZ57DRAFT_905007 [Hyaloscypha finlandica]
MIQSTMKAYMGDSSMSTVCAAELQGIRLALMMALQDWDKGNRRKKLIIYTDNQAAIRTVGNPVEGVWKPRGCCGMSQVIMSHVPCT